MCVLLQQFLSFKVVDFKRIINPHFPCIPPDVVQNLSTDQYYGYRMAMAVILGEVDEDLALLEVGEIFHARWLTLACRILRYYVSVKKPSSNLNKVLAEFVIKIYFPSWFEIKYKNKVTEAAPNFYNIINRVRCFPSTKVKKILLKVLQRNGFSIHSENVLLAMLADKHEEVRRKAVNKILALRGVLPDFSLDDGSWAGTEIDGNVSSSEDEDHAEGPSKSVRIFKVPSMLNTKAKVYYKLIDLDGADVSEPPATLHLSTEQLQNMYTSKLELELPCHNQAVERHVKVVTEASMMVCGFERRDGLIRQKLKSRKLMKCFNTKMQFQS